mmetsp:Transcript_72454/g.206282  ORF Transcript_72454/g.206282 Transcript_72454/m.206282 type:complete len:227 (-) Transcript_72454:549-1229(-)
MSHLHRIWELLVKKFLYLLTVPFLELLELRVRCEECAGEGAVVVGKCDKHERAPRPDVQVVRLHGVLAVAHLMPWRQRRHGQLLVALLHIVRVKVEPAVPVHSGARGREGAVTSEGAPTVPHHLRRLARFWVGLGRLEGHTTVPVHLRELHSELILDPLAERQLHQLSAHLRPRHRVDRLRVVFAVLLHRSRAVLHVEVAAGHGDRHIHNTRVSPGGFQRLNASVR